jgi:hypothetical protein
VSTRYIPLYLALLSLLSTVACVSYVPSADELPCGVRRVCLQTPVCVRAAHAATRVSLCVRACVCVCVCVTTPLPHTHTHTATHTHTHTHAQELDSHDETAARVQDRFLLKHREDQGKKKKKTRTQEELNCMQSELAILYI